MSGLQTARELGVSDRLFGIYCHSKMSKGEFMVVNSYNGSVCRDDSIG